MPTNPKPKLPRPAEGLFGAHYESADSKISGELRSLLEQVLGVEIPAHYLEGVEMALDRIAAEDSQPTVYEARTHLSQLLSGKAPRARDPKCEAVRRRVDFERLSRERRGLPSDTRTCVRALLQRLDREFPRKVGPPHALPSRRALITAVAHLLTRLGVKPTASASAIKDKHTGTVVTVLELLLEHHPLLAGKTTPSLPRQAQSMAEEGIFGAISRN